jgi:hypothetical protein
MIKRHAAKQKAPKKLPNLLVKIRECIEQEKYIFTNHALDRVNERGIDIQTTIDVLLRGYEEKKKTKFDKETDAWKYAIRGLTTDGFDIRVIIAFDEDEMLVITVMHVL